MRISDWSSDVCSSDLDRAFETIGDAAGNVPDGKRHRDRDHAVDRIMPAEMDRADPDQRRIRRDHPAERAPQAESGDREQRGETIVDRGHRRNAAADRELAAAIGRSEEHTSELQSLMRISYAVFCLKKKKKQQHKDHNN